MMISEDDHFELHERLRQTVGDRSAATLMTRVFGMEPDRVATKDDLAELRGELHDEIAGVRAEIAGVRGEIAEVRWDSARQTRQFTLTLLIAFLAHFAATAGLVLSLG